MDRDLRESPLYQEVEEHFRKVYEPGFGTVTEPADPRPSPDGRWVAFTGSIWEKLEGTPMTRICLAPMGRKGAVAGAELGAARQISSGPERDAGPRWSPDGRRLSFVSDRREKGRMQLFVLTLEGLGEAEALPEIEGTIEDHAWSPDGARILARSAGLHADSAGAEGSGALASEKDLPEWTPKVDSWEDRQLWRRLWVIEVSSGAVRALSRDDLNVWEAEWCGDRSVVAVASEDPGESSWYRAPLVLIDAVSGEDRVIATSDVQFGLPSGALDGSRVAAIEAPCSDRQLVSGKAVIVEPDGSASRRIEIDDADITWVGWRPDGRLAYTALRRGDTVFGHIDPATGTRDEVWSTTDAVGAWAPYAAPFGEDGFAFVRQGFDRPAEVAVLDGDSDRTIASFRHAGHDHGRSLVGRAERVSWNASDGLEMDGFLLAPGGDGPHPLILHVHGGPVWSYQQSFPRPSLSWLVSRGYAILLPNPRGSTGRGRAFLEAVIGDMGGLDAQDDLAGIDALVERGDADPERVGVTGGSYGGFMSCWLPVVDQRFKAAVAVSPVTDYFSQHWNSNIGAWDSWFLGGQPEDGTAHYRERSPVFFVDRVTTPTLLTAGTEDRCTPPGQAMEFYRALRERDVPVEVAIYPGEGHGVRKFPAYLDLVTRTTAWFERFMPAGR
ncbi:MAG TPA: S9 family peptidase [Actinomycetota bacterium]|nr:S9 family peptidase [Actinomycetota bacterium]